jgi:uridine phosphorylase
VTEERFNPQSTIEYFTSLHGISIEEMDVAPLVVLSWGFRMIDALVEATGAKAAKYWLYPDRYPLFTGEVGGRRVSLFHAPLGAPGTVMMMEELIVSGARTFIGLGWAGSLQPYAPVGTFLVPTGCVREEGTSFHYFDASVELTPHAGMVELLRQEAEVQNVPVFPGTLWTTDAPYRELVSKVESYAQEGVLGVDMETSAMYALGAYRGVKVCNFLVVSDELWDEWAPAFFSEELEKANECARQVILRCLANDALYEE